MSSATSEFAREIAMIVAEELKRSRPSKELYSVEDAAVYLGCSSQQVRNFMDTGKLQAIKIDSRPRFRVRDLERFIESSKA